MPPRDDRRPCAPSADRRRRILRLRARALATGLLRLFFYAKGVDFYLGNPFFWAKMALYVVIAALSIKPTRTFIQWKRAIVSGGAGPAGGEVAGVRRLIHIELGLLALMPLMAVLMARGLGR